MTQPASPNSNKPPGMGTGELLSQANAEHASAAKTNFTKASSSDPWHAFKNFFQGDKKKFQQFMSTLLQTIANQMKEDQKKAMKALQDQKDEIEGKQPSP